MPQFLSRQLHDLAVDHPFNPTIAANAGRIKLRPGAFELLREANGAGILLARADWAWYSYA
jgi:hypothetical protein